MVQFALTTAAFLLYDARFMGDYGITFVALISTIESMIAYLITIWKVADIQKFTIRCEEFIKNSEFDWLLFINHHFQAS